MNYCHELCVFEWLLTVFFVFVVRPENSRSTLRAVTDWLPIRSNPAPNPVQARSKPGHERVCSGLAPSLDRAWSGFASNDRYATRRISAPIGVRLVLSGLCCVECVCSI